MRSDLAHARQHEPVRIRSIGGEPAFRRRLLELGFLPGTVVRLRGVAPLGDPVQVELRGCRFSIRRAEAAAIAVTPASTVALPVVAVAALP